MSYREPDLEIEDWDDYRKYEAEELSLLSRIRKLEEEVSRLHGIIDMIFDDNDDTLEEEDLPEIPLHTTPAVEKWIQNY